MGYEFKDQDTEPVSIFSSCFTVRWLQEDGATDVVYMHSNHSRVTCTSLNLSGNEATE
jgi:hypothetical protein